MSTRLASLAKNLRKNQTDVEDIERNKVFIEKGYKVLRFWNGDVLENEQEVLEVIRENCMK
jgi:very-short-patch-repair endonuclease